MTATVVLFALAGGTVFGLILSAALKVRDIRPYFAGSAGVFVIMYVVAVIKEGCSRC